MPFSATSSGGQRVIQVGQKILEKKGVKKEVDWIITRVSPLVTEELIDRKTQS